MMKKAKDADLMNTENEQQAKWVFVFFALLFAAVKITVTMVAIKLTMKVQAIMMMMFI